MSSDITLTASDVGALPDSTVIPAQTAKIWTGTCRTTNETATKVVTLDDPTGFSLTAGVRILVYFENYHTSSTTPKLNVNNTGEKSVWMGTYDGQARNSQLIKWANYESVLFTYRGDSCSFEGSGSSFDSILAITINGKSLFNTNITLTASDVNALPSSTTYVSSVNGNSGAVTITDSDEKLKTTLLDSTDSKRKELLEVVKDRPEKNICIWLDTSVETCEKREDRGRPKGLVRVHREREIRTAYI